MFLFIGALDHKRAIPAKAISCNFFLMGVRFDEWNLTVA
jgi:hypothetical protein